MQLSALSICNIEIQEHTRLENKTQKISIGDKLSIEFINEVLFEYEFERVDYVAKPGEFSVRGGIIDVF